jgi:hypothetical protein
MVLETAGIVFSHGQEFHPGSMATMARLARRVSF